MSDINVQLKRVVHQYVIHRGNTIQVTLDKTGSQGVQGEPGDPGQDGSDATDKHFELPFTDLTTLIVTHNLGKKPAVAIINSANEEVECDVVHNSSNTVTIYSSASFSGMVVFN